MLRVIGSNNQVTLQGSFKGSFEERVLSSGTGALVQKSKIEGLLKAAEGKTQKDLVNHLIKSFPMSSIDSSQLPQEMLQRDQASDVVVVDLRILEIIMQEIRFDMSEIAFKQFDEENRFQIMRLNAKMS
jgi:hypothetical protein